MKRPDFITQQDIARWDDNIDNDPNILDFWRKDPQLRETIYAGLWLAERLKLAGCSDLLITRIQYTTGQLSFGHNPWDMAQDMLYSYLHNLLEFEIDYNETN
jgi:hypothetical protein